MKIEKIISTANAYVEGNSLRDREVRRLISENLRVEKHGRWYTVYLMDAMQKVYCSAKYCNHAIMFLIDESGIYRIAKKNVKERFKEAIS